MITNDTELEVVQEQLALAEGTLASLRRDGLPKNRTNYEVFAEGYVEQIHRLRVEIDEYLDLTQAANARPPGSDGPPNGVTEFATANPRDSSVKA